MGSTQPSFPKLEEATRWSKLRAIGNSGLVRSSALIPIIGYLILLNDKVADWIQILGDVDISPRLIMLYVGLSFVGTASILYSIFCPEIIRRYGTAVEYTTSESGYFMVRNNFNYVKASVRGDLNKLPSWQVNTLGLTDPDIRSDEHIPPQEHIVPLMTARWHIRNFRMPRLRMAIGILYGVGFTISAVPAAWSFGQTAWVIGQQVAEWSASEPDPQVQNTSGEGDQGLG
ncbi:MAG TPA: hypothetical protein VGR19_02120 [Allosphingosinicella sp.]|nr:hypothetical protein [Allosphingosinicella sp.]